MFPEQVKEGLRPWKPLKDYALVPFSPVTDKGILDYVMTLLSGALGNYTDGTITKGALSASVEFAQGEYNPLLGLTRDRSPAWVSATKSRRAAAPVCLRQKQR